MAYVNKAYNIVGTHFIVHNVRTFGVGFISLLFFFFYLLTRLRASRTTALRSDTAAEPQQAFPPPYAPPPSPLTLIDGTTRGGTHVIPCSTTAAILCFFGRFFGADCSGQFRLLRRHTTFVDRQYSRCCCLVCTILAFFAAFDCLLLHVHPLSIVLVSI